MSLVTRGMGGNSLLVTGGLGFKDLITQIIEDDNLGGSQFHDKKIKRSYSFLKDYTFKVNQASVFNLVNEFSDVDGMPVAEATENFLSNKVIEVDDQDYGIQVLPDDIETLVNTAHDLDEKIKSVMQEADVMRQEAKRMLMDRAKKEIKHSMDHQKTIFNNDMDLLEILLLADEL